ncbi:HNH endonuclease signature motif containing protein [Oryzihumus leptocrescens]|nr:HNH endonuclease signature motif containing protein [Oryzihumus leptocrescens]
MGDQLDRRSATPREVLDALVRVVRADAPAEAQWFTADEALRVIEAGEAVKAWVDAVSLDCTRALAGRVFEARDDLCASAEGRPRTDDEWDRVREQAAQAAASEIEAATGMGYTECRARVSFALAEEERTATVRERMHSGCLSSYHARLLFEETRHCPPDVADGIAGRVLGDDGDVPASHATLRRRLRRQLVLHDSDYPRRARADAVSRRRVRSDLRPNGTGWLDITGDGERIVAARERIEAIARRLKAEGRGDQRAHDAICSDVALDLLLYGWVTDDEPYRSLGRPPAAHVTVTVSLATLLGVTEGTGEIPGHGFVQAHHVREIATAAGSVWRRLVTDPVTGELLDLGTQRYVPTPRMRELVVHRDGVCRGPGCEVEARRCDLDLEIAWPLGPTHPANLAAKHRRHHNLKSHGWWTSTMTHNGRVHWRSAAGRAYVTHPRVYDDPLDAPLTADDPTGVPRTPDLRRGDGATLTALGPPPF